MPEMLHDLVRRMGWLGRYPTITAVTSDDGVLLHTLIGENSEGMENQSFYVPYQLLPASGSMREAETMGLMHTISEPTEPIPVHNGGTALTPEVLDEMINTLSDEPEDWVPNYARMTPQRVQFYRTLAQEETDSLRRYDPIRLSTNESVDGFRRGFAYVEPTPTAVGRWTLGVDWAIGSGAIQSLRDPQDFDIEALRSDPRFGKVEKKPGKEITIIDKTHGT
jgi:hypothetical protein